MLIISLLVGYSLQAQVTVKPVLDTQRVAIVPFDYARDGSHIPTEDMERGMFTSPSSIAAFYREASYGKMTLDGVVYPYRTDQPPLYGTGYTNCYPDDAVMVNQPDVDYSHIDGIIIFSHDTVSGKSCSAGLSSSSKLPFNTADGPYEFRRSGFRTEFYFPNDFSQTTSSTIAHELMHSFGNDFHSNSYVKENGEWKVQGYGNLFDILGLRSQASHPCSMIKHKLGWLTENEIENVTQTDTFRLYPLEKNLPGQTQCLIIELPNLVDIQPNDNFKFDRLYLEYRGLTGFDFRTANARRVRLKDDSFYANDDPHGLCIVGVDCSARENCLPILIDMHPDPIGGVGASYFPHEATDAPLKLGEKYVVPDNSIEIEVIHVSEENYLDVVITMPSVNAVSNNELSSIRVYPSPVQDLLQIEHDKNADLEFRLFDLYGRLVMSRGNARTLDLSDIGKGIYILVIRDTDSHKVTSERIVKM